MTFLQPFILWGLPLILLPVLIHLFNRLRHRPQPWAAMMFLRSATRKSTRYARLRQWLVLLLRVLAVAAFLLALSRPLGGGWMGWLAGRAPDTVLILLDRSASMEAVEPGGQSTRRERALTLLGRTAQALENTSRLVLIDSALRMPREVESASLLLELPATRATDTMADFPSLMQEALDWIAQNQPGSLEIWIASDLQWSNWNPESERWTALRGALRDLPQSVRVRLLGLDRPVRNNQSLTLARFTRLSREGKQSLLLVADVQRQAGDPASLPLAVGLNGVDQQVDLRMETRAVRYRHEMALPEDVPAGWGRLALPLDDLPADNEVFFVYAPEVAERVAIVAEDSFVAQVMRLACVSGAEQTNRVADLLAPERLPAVGWKGYSLVIWQGDLPPAGLRAELEAYVEEGGVLLMLPGGGPGAWAGQSWGDIREAPAEESWTVTQWETQAGPLADSASGLPLPLDEMRIQKRQAHFGTSTALAAFSDGAPFLSRQSLGEGQIYYCTTLPRPDWSPLHEGAILLPMLTRLIQTGGERFRTARQVPCGQDVGSQWNPVESSGASDPRLHAGVYRDGNRWLAVNRPGPEDDGRFLEPAAARELFQGVGFRMFAEKEEGRATVQSELWRWFLLFMLGFLVMENLLILPETGMRRRKA